MTETKWLQGTDPKKLLESFREKREFQRKLRLFAVACCYPIWNHLDTWSQETVRLVEQVYDGKGTAVGPDFWERWNMATPLWHKTPQDCRTFALRAAAMTVSRSKDVVAAQNVMDLVQKAMMLAEGEYDRLPPRGRRAYNRRFRAFWTVKVRCIFGNPFQPILINPDWLAWNERLVHRIAQAIYDERTFNHMPILADALEEAGCDHAGILAHCRQPGGHARGCWVVDLLLGNASARSQILQ